MEAIREWAKKKPLWRRWYLEWRIATRSNRYRIIGILRHGVRWRSGYQIMFYPDMPREHKVIVKICLTAGYKMRNTSGSGVRLAIAWNDNTFREPVRGGLGLAPGTHILNGECVDVSKRTLDDHHQVVFGYQLGVDPMSFKGKGIKKSNLNARHDGSEVMLPITVSDDGVVYQRRIDNRCGNDLVMDIRVPVIGADIPFAYLKYRPIESRFGNVNTFVEMAPVYEVLTEVELRKILELCRRLGLDYGELDTLRDRSDGRLYVVDVNHTPAGPPNGLSSADYWRALERMSDSFHQQFVDRRDIGRSNMESLYANLAHQ